MKNIKSVAIVSVMVLLTIVTFEIVVIFGQADKEFSWGTPFDMRSCSLSLSPAVKSEISSYKAAAGKIQDYIKKGAFKHKFYNDLAYFVDTFGSRSSGSPLYESAVDFMYEQMKEFGLENAHPEYTVIPNWQRDVEEAYMISPRRRRIAIMGFGRSAPTPPGGITAQIIIVPNFKWLKAKANHGKLVGKIAVFDLEGREKGIRLFREQGGMEALRAGAVAALGRSVVSMSIYSVSARSYISTAYPIPIASITNEDTDLFIRLCERGVNVTLTITMNSTFSNMTSKNVMGDYLGKEKPNEILLLNGHMDSWDISQGAQDDGCGSVLALKIPQVLKSLSLQPQRSIRTLLNVASEYNFLGSRQYLAAHAPELGNHVGMMLADAGCAKPMGYIIAPNYPKLGCLLAEIGRLFDPSLSNPSIFTSADTYTSTLVFNENRAPSILLNGDAGKYYWLRHTYADTMTHLNRYTLDDILVFWTTTAYVLADMVNKISDL